MEFIFSNHALQRMETRRLTEEEVLTAIRFSDKTQKKYNKYFAQKDIGLGKIEVVYEKTEKYIRIITVYWV